MENQNKPRTQYILQNPEMTVHLKRFGAAEAHDQNRSNDSGYQKTGGDKKSGQAQNETDGRRNDPREVKVKTWRQTANVHPRRTVGQGSWSVAQLKCIC